MSHVSDDRGSGEPRGSAAVARESSQLVLRRLAQNLRLHLLRKLRQRGVVPRRPLLQKGPAAVLFDRLLDFFIRRHNKGAVPGHRLLESLPGENEKGQPLVIRGDLDPPCCRVGRVEANCRAMLHRRRIPPDRPAALLTVEVQKQVVEILGQCVHKGAAGRKDHVEHQRAHPSIERADVGRSSSRGVATSDHTDRSPRLLRDVQRNSVTRYCAIVGVAHLELRRHVHPNLESVALFALRAAASLGVLDPAAGLHPLHCRRLDGGAVAHRVGVPCCAAHHVSEQILSPMWMPSDREVVWREFTGGHGGAELVTHQERVTLLRRKCSWEGLQHGKGLAPRGVGDFGSADCEHTHQHRWPRHGRKIWPRWTLPRQHAACL
mmetsp:Transcript_8173/g.20873  ORF Transcript_8173/g.20873 Transcript_8173/m.20873 type:complete len:377 (+) Transcript_8173:732-1862(+)